MSAATELRTLQALREWKTAYERTDLVARILAAAISDYRALGINLNLGTAIETQLDRYEQARELEEEAHTNLEHTRGAA